MVWDELERIEVQQISQGGSKYKAPVKEDQYTRHQSNRIEGDDCVNDLCKGD